MPRRIDSVTRELCQLLAQDEAFEFKSLFAIVHQRLRARDEHGVGEEMLRLRTYTRLQQLMDAKLVRKSAGKYKGNRAGLVNLASGSSPKTPPKYRGRKPGNDSLISSEDDN
jgi:hypothetical protein